MPDVRSGLPEWIVQKVDSLQKTCDEIYLVGGAIRDLILGIQADDYDFVVKKGAVSAAQTMANAMGGDFYILDKQRQTARAIVAKNNAQIHLDFALFNGKNIIEDLQARDFTINAIALRLPEAGEFLDPTGGKEDLKNKRLKPCSRTAFIDDPVRTIRYVRFLEEMGFDPIPEIEDLIKEALPKLDQVSCERQRDALMDMIRVANLQNAFNYLLDIGLIPTLFPGAEHLKEVALSPPHTYNAWDHTMQVMHYCQQLMMCFDLAPSLPNTHPRIQQALLHLKKYHSSLQIFFQQPVTPGRNKYQLLAVSALYHDYAKGVVEFEFKGERKKFPGHAKRGAKIVRDWAKRNNLSKNETRYLHDIVRMHMKVSRPEMLDEKDNRINIYKFFKRAGDAGILTCILHLADVLTTYEDAMTDDRWIEALSAVEKIFDAYFFHYDEIVDPVPLINGSELMRIFDISPGKQVGYLLGKLQEAQVSKKVSSHDQAVAYVNEIISMNNLEEIS